MTHLDAATVRRRYLVLIGLRWFSTGLLIPIFSLLMLTRGLSLVEIGLVAATQGLVILVLELPTGGLSDALGRRPVLILASVTAILALAMLYFALRILQGATIVGMGLLAGAVGLITAYLACYLAHGASNPMHTALLHREVDSRHRTTVLSLNSMVFHPAAAIGALVLTSIATATSLATAMVVGGIVCAVAAPLYLPAWRAERERAQASITAAASG